MSAPSSPAYSSAPSSPAAPSSPLGESFVTDTLTFFASPSAPKEMKTRKPTCCGNCGKGGHNRQTCSEPCAESPSKKAKTASTVEQQLRLLLIADYTAKVNGADMLQLVQLWQQQHVASIPVLAPAQEELPLLSI